MRLIPALLLSTSLALGACSHAPAIDKDVLAASQPFMAMPVVTTKVHGDIHVVSGVGGNVLVIAGKDGTLLADTGVTPRTEALEGELQKLHAAKVTEVIDTHFHYDHVGGNAFYGAKGATIIAQENVKTRLLTPQRNDFFDKTFPAAPKEGLPTVTFSQGYKLTAAGHTLELTHPAKNAHTDGDAYVFVRDVNVLFTGDLFFNGLYPFIDYSVGGNIDGMIAAVDQMLKLANNDTKIIPGHGPVGNKADLKAFRTMLATISRNVHRQIKAGKTEEQVVAAKPTAAFDRKWAGGLFNGDAFTRIVYRGLNK